MNILGIGSIIESVGKIADELITTDAEKLELDIKKQELLLKSKELELTADANDSNNITNRWTSDMNSDSWLSKNVRPMVLIYLLTAYTIFSIGSAFDINITKDYVELLAQWGMLVMSAYFGGRTMEKIFSHKNK